MDLSRRTVTKAAALAAATTLTPRTAWAGVRVPTEAGTGDLSGIELMPDLPVPPAPAAGRGAALDGMLPVLSHTHADDPTLADAVTQYRRFQWPALYERLDRLAHARPDVVDTMRLQADVYLYHGRYEEALSRLDAVLRLKPHCIHALSMTSLIRRALGHSADYEARMGKLTAGVPAAATAMKDLLALVERTRAVRFGRAPQTSVEPQAIVVPGGPVLADGAPTLPLLQRVQEAQRLADRHPKALVVLSGGPVTSTRAEADVMASLLIGRGVARSRVVTDVRALDVVGSAMGVTAALRARDLHDITLVTSAPDVARAVVAFRAYSQRVGYRMRVDAVTTSILPRRGSQEWERRYGYVTAARAAALYEWKDFQKFKNPPNTTPIPDTAV